jgi:hypothetical protein
MPSLTLISIPVTRRVRKATFVNKNLFIINQHVHKPEWPICQCLSINWTFTCKKGAKGNAQCITKLARKNCIPPGLNIIKNARVIHNFLKKMGKRWYKDIYSPVWYHIILIW